MKFRICNIALAMLFIVLLVGCGTPVYRQGIVNKGSFEIGVPENFAGVGKAIPENSTINSFSVGFDYTTSAEMKVRGVKNSELKLSDYDPLYGGSDNDFTVIKETKVKSFKYKRNRFPLSASYTRLTQKSSEFYGFSAGVDPEPYGRFIFGANKESFEFGGYVDLELGVFGIGDVTVDYYECLYVYSKEERCSERTEERHFETDDGAFWRAGLGFFASYFVKNFALSYSPYLYKPHLQEFFDIKDEDGISAEFGIPVIYPWVLSQYAGASLWLNEHWKVSLGVTVLNSLDFDDFFLTANGSIGFWF